MFNVRDNRLSVGYCFSGAYTLHRDGSVSDPRIPAPAWNYPPPDNEVRMGATFCKSKFDRITMDYLAYPKDRQGWTRITLTAYKSRRFPWDRRKHIAPTPAPFMSFNEPVGQKKQSPFSSR